MKFIFVFFATLSIYWNALSQDSEGLRSSSFKVGQTSPDFQFDSVESCSRTTISLSNTRGKWLLLNFIARGCASSFTQLTRIDSLQRLYPELLQTLLIAKTTEKYGNDAFHMRNEYEQFKQYYQLNTPIVYDSTVYKQLRIRTTPYSILINPEGIVMATFSVNSASTKVIHDFIKGRLQTIPGDLRVSNQKEANFNRRVPLLINNNGGNESSSAYRAIITDELPIGGGNPICVSNTHYGNKIEILNMTVRDLLKYAYYDTVGIYPNFSPNCYSTYFTEPVFNFTLSAEDSIAYVINRHCYSQIVPSARSNALFMQQIMRDNLKNFFGLVASVERRKMPVYKLISIGDTNMIATKGGTPLGTNSDLIYGQVQFRNVSMQEVIKTLWGRYRPNIPIIDGTGIRDNVDILLATLRTQPLEEAILSLNKNGLDLVKAESEMYVILVSKYISSN